MLPMCFPVKGFAMRLSKSNISALKLPDGKSEAILFDDQLPGFGIRLRSGGKRTWIAQYRVGQKQRRVTIGSVDAIDAEEARKTARSIIAKVQLGGDPQIEKRVSKAQAQDTVGGLVARYLASHGEKRLGARTLVEVRRTLTVAWKPLHELPVHGVQRHTVATRLAEIAEENGPFAANRARSYLSAMFNWAIMQGVADQNPVIGTGKVTKEVSRDRVLSDAELAMVWQQAGDGDYGRVIRLLILTGQRREEVAAMPWPEINFKDKVWSIDANRTKNGRPHDVPLSGAALSLLDEAGRREGRELAFGAGDGPFSGWSKCKAALDRRILAAIRAVDKKAKAPPLWRIHDIRRTVATRMSDLGVQPHVVEAVLNHVSGHRAGVAGVYNRAAYSAEKRAALDLWARHIEGIVHGRT